MRFQDTSAFCTELKSFAALEDLTVSFVKQERNVVNAAMSQVFHPVPRTFFAPSHSMNSTPALDTARYNGGSADCCTLLRTAAVSQFFSVSSYRSARASSQPWMR